MPSADIVLASSQQLCSFIFFRRVLCVQVRSGAKPLELGSQVQKAGKGVVGLRALKATCGGKKSDLIILREKSQGSKELEQSGILVPRLILLDTGKFRLGWGLAIDL